MRLCIATPLYPPEPGGPATYAALLERELPKHGIDVSVVKFAMVRSYPPGIRHIAYLLNVYRAASDSQLVLALDPVSTGLPAYLAARMAHKPFIVKIVGDYAWEQGTQRYGITESLDDFVKRKQVPFMVGMFRTIQTYVARSAKRVIVPSKYLKGIVSAWGIPEHHIEVIYNAIPIEVSNTLPESVAAVPHPFVVTVGRLVPWKHMDAVMDAVSSLEGDANLVVVGSGPLRSSLEKHANDVLPGHVVFTDGLSHSDTLAVMSHADVFVLNSSYEGFSHLLIEAQALGVPSVATAVGGNPELITSGENGVLVPAGDTKALGLAIQAILNDSAGAVQLRERARERAKAFTPELMVEKTKQLLLSV